MTNLQIDILNVMSFNEWLSVKEIRRKLEVESDRSFGEFNTKILTALWGLDDKGWIESKPSESITNEELAIRHNSALCFSYRKIKNGRRIPEKRSSWFGKLLGANA